MFYFLFSSNHSTIALIIHTEPEANIPSKKIPRYGCRSKCVVVGEKKYPIRNPTHVEVHMTQLINPDRM